jgi:hypothetical protein
MLCPRGIQHPPAKPCRPIEFDGLAGPALFFGNWIPYPDAGDRAADVVSPLGYPGRQEFGAVSATKSRIMYIERKAESLNGPARIGRVTFSKTGRTVTYRGQSFFKADGFKSNHIEAESGAAYWISGPRRDGRDRLYPQSTLPVEIDEDVRDAYWAEIRGLPMRCDRTRAN